MDQPDFSAVRYFSIFSKEAARKFLPGVYFCFSSTFSLALQGVLCPRTNAIITRLREFTLRAAIIFRRAVFVSVDNPNRRVYAKVVGFFENNARDKMRSHIFS